MHIPTTPGYEVISQTSLLNGLLSHAFNQQFSVAVWQLPGQQKVELLLSKKSRYISREEPLEDLPEGFIFAPFDRNDNSIFLNADFLFTFSEGVLAKAKGRKEELSHEWLHELNLTAHSPNKFGHYCRKDPLPFFPSKETFCTLVEKAITEIENGVAEKIVPSRVRKVPLPAEPDPIESFEKLCRAFPNAMVTFVSTPESGTWIGASPELLVCVKDSTFKTVALAGTQAYHAGIDLKSVAWTQKEIEEQALVERYIISCFKKIRLREYEEQGPKTVIAGNLMHLRSDFTVDMKETNFPQLGSVMLQLLHPTSAVCGMPLDNARTFLEQHEGYDRTYYSGYLGPVNINHEIHIFVNLRCMQLRNDCALLYAGAGVTADSWAEKEWDETEMKMNTLLRALIA
jgi:isochorismate synthase